MRLFQGIFFKGVLESLLEEMGQRGRLVQTDKWQGTELHSKPGSQMVELLHHSISVNLDGETCLDSHAQDIQPNLPWCDTHFLERICGYPINPGTEWENWPWSNNARDSLDENGMFNHNYMERYWPSYGVTHFANRTPEEAKTMTMSRPIKGLRHDYGDLNDLCELLAFEPSTRQAYLPVWFPEDTGVSHSDRKPCTLGYHFIVRDGRIDVNYYIRSCDLVRHLRDDIYLTIRLMLYIIDKCTELNPEEWDQVQPGEFNMHIANLHMFVGDYTKAFRRLPGEG